jgi:hypothetical protein
MEAPNNAKAALIFVVCIVAGVFAYGWISQAIAKAQTPATTTEEG